MMNNNAERIGICRIDLNIRQVFIDPYLLAPYHVKNCNEISEQIVIMKLTVRINTGEVIGC